MVHCIYCYTNLINNKKYVGQTNNLDRRIREHKSNAFNPKSVNYNNILHKAMRKYGYENFEIEVLEILFDQDFEIVNAKEAFWIKEKNSLVSGHGYNVLDGGTQAWKSFLSKEQIDEIISLIKKGTPYSIICNQYGLSKTFISNINTGFYFHKENQQYPYYKYRIDDDIYDALVEDLEKPELTYRELAKKYDIGESTVKKFNYGSLRPGYYQGEYPIRKITPGEYKAQQIIDYLLNTNLSKKEIVELTNSSDETVRRINLGTLHHQKDLQYPLR